MATSLSCDVPRGRGVALLRALALGIAVSGTLLGVTCAAEAAPPKRTSSQAPGYYRIELGDIEITVLSDGTIPQAAEALLPDLGAEARERLLRRAYRTSPLETSINAFLIHTGHELVLIDTGAGDLLDGQAGELPTSLRAAGYRASEIDLVLLTHLHPDHIGGLVRDGKAFFPRAQLYVEQAEARFWLDAGNRANAPEALRPRFDEAAQMVAPYQREKRFRTFVGVTKLASGVRALPGSGHTPGHALYEVTSKGQKLVCAGDFVHLPFQFAEPHLTVVHDLNPLEASRRRMEAFAQAADQRYLVALAHASFPGVGNVRRESSGYTWLPIDYDRRLGGTE